MKSRIQKTRGESGAALLSVICLIFMGSLLTTAVLALSKIATFDVAAHTVLQRSFYINEGVANRMQFLIEADRRTYTNRQLGNLDYSSYEDDRYMADGIPHEIDYYGTPVKVTITDAAGGFNLSSRSYDRVLRSISERLSVLGTGDEDLTDYFANLRARIKDYLDSDDDVGTNGAEADDYEAEKKDPLPRNNAMQFREEFFFIPEFTHYFKPDSEGFLTSVQILMQNNMAASGLRSNFFSSPPETIQMLCQLDDSELETVLAARNRWYLNRTTISDSLNDPNLLQKLQGGISFSESGYYQLKIEPGGTTSSPSRRLRCIFNATGVAGPSDNIRHYLDWIAY